MYLCVGNGERQLIVAYGTTTTSSYLWFRTHDGSRHEYLLQMSMGPECLRFLDSGQAQVIDNWNLAAYVR